MSLFTTLLQDPETASNIDDQINAITGNPGIQETAKALPVWELVKAGEWYIMIPLAVMSVLAIYIFIERFMAITHAVKEEKDFMAKIREYILSGKLDSAKNLCSTTDNPIARMVEKGINRIGKSMREIHMSIENVSELEVNRLEKGISVLGTIAGAAPMIGFLGTTLGMIKAFHQMQFSATIKISELAPGIMQAMVTTVGGLIVGIIAYIAYNTLTTKIEKVIHKMQGSSIEFIDLLEEPGN